MSDMKKKNERKTCPNCGEVFTGRRNQKFCSKYCRFRYWADRHPRVKSEEMATGENVPKPAPTDTKVEYSE